MNDQRPNPTFMWISHIVGASVIIFNMCCLFVYLIRALFRMKKTGDVAKVPKEQWIIKPEEDNFLVVERQIFSIHFRY